mgnify:CR=1 FL=1|jgi:hypothetical protein
MFGAFLYECSGQAHLKVSAGQINDTNEVVCISISSGFPLGGLNKTVDTFEYPVVYSGDNIPDNSIPVPFDKVSSFLDGLDIALLPEDEHLMYQLSPFINSPTAYLGFLSSL